MRVAPVASGTEAMLGASTARLAGRYPTARRGPSVWDQTATAGTPNLRFETKRRPQAPYTRGLGPNGDRRRRTPAVWDQTVTAGAPNLRFGTKRWGRGRDTTTAEPAIGGAATPSPLGQVAKPAWTWSWCVSSLNHWGAAPRR